MGEYTAQDPTAAALVGKGKRVAGVFAFLMGNSIILDAHAFWLGLPIALAGAVAWVWGTAQQRVRDAGGAVPDATESQP